MTPPCDHHWIRILGYWKCTRCGDLRSTPPESTREDR